MKHSIFLIVLNNEIKPLEDNNKKNKLFSGENQVNNYIEVEEEKKQYRNEIIDKYDLKEGNNNIKLIIKNNLNNMSYMFYGCKSLYNIEELKYLDVSKCTNFSYMFWGCYSLSDIKPLEKWDVSKCTYFGYMFDDCSRIVDKTLINTKFN